MSGGLNYPFWKNLKPQNTIKTLKKQEKTTNRFKHFLRLEPYWTDWRIVHWRSINYLWIIHGSSVDHRIQGCPKDNPWIANKLYKPDVDTFGGGLEGPKTGSIGPKMR